MAKTKAKLELPVHLLNEIEAGNVVLMLGAGASRGAKDAKGASPPLGGELASMIASKFLTASYGKLPLNQVVAYAISQSDLVTVQEFIAGMLNGFSPTTAHVKLKSFRWKGIATTNFDTLVEDAYRDASVPSAQNLVTFIDNTDRPDELLRDRNSLLYLKLHGCITRIKDPRCPLILTTEQYNTHEDGRERVFNRLLDWATERPILFAGYSLQDANLLGLIQKIQKKIPSPPRCFLVTLGIDEIQRTHWDKFRISAFNGSFDDLADVLDKKIGSLFRGLRQTSETGNLAISDRFIRSDVTLPFNTTQFLERDVDYVKSVAPAERIDPEQFYKGVDSEWSAIEQDLDVHRHLAEQILMDHILPETANQTASPCFVVVKSHAGSGKTILLQRLAWEAARKFDKLCLKLRPEGVLNAAAIANLADQVKERIFIFVDDVVERRREIASLYGPRSSIAGRITVVATARTNEWNLAPESLTSFATVYELKYLSTVEIDGLLSKLEAHDSLGTLAKLTSDQRRAAFLERADRQLLVALHEATLGKHFEDIIKDEYEQITPARAQLMYLTVCMLYQFGSPVRAGLISRLYQLPFEEFEKSFFKPLEQIIRVARDKVSADMVYMARHPHIAELVVSTVLQNKEELFHEVLKAIRFINPSYSSDKVAYRKLLNGTSLLHAFPDHQMVVQIFDAAQEAAGEDAYLLQQKCIYEMKRPDGNLSAADGYIQKALASQTRPRALLHTQSELFIRRAEAAAHPLDRKRYLDEAIKICEGLQSRKDDPFPFYTLLKIRTIQIKDALRSEDADDDALDHLVRSAEKILQSGVTLHPENAFLRSAEADLETALSHAEKAVKAMERSFELNPRGSHIAVRLAKHYESIGCVDRAIDVYRKALAAKPGDTKIHYLYARLLVDKSLGTDDEICHHLRKSFSPGDRMAEPRLLYGRHLFLTGNFGESAAIFDELKSHRMSPESRTRLRYPVAAFFTGQVAYVEASYCMIRRTGDHADVYCSRDDLTKSEWDLLSRGCRVKFKIAFTMNGVRAHTLLRD